MVRTILGIRGSGKTTQIKARIRQTPRVAVFDLCAEYHDVCEPRQSTAEFVSFLEDRRDSVFRVLLTPPGDEDLGESFDIFLEACWTVGDMMVVVDEIDMVSSPTVIPRQLLANLRLGRHRDLDLIGCARRAAEVPRTLTANSGEVICFYQHEPNDIKYLERFVSKDFAAAVQRLPEYHYVRFVGGKRPEQQDLTPVLSTVVL